MDNRFHQLDVTVSVANVSISRQAFLENSWPMESNRRDCIRRITGWTLGWNAVRFLPGTASANACMNDSRGFEAEFSSMGSKINLRWYSNQTDQDHIAEAAGRIADQWVKVLSDYDPNSQSALACAKADLGNWTPLSNELWSVVQMCDQWHRWSNGAFDAALGAITHLRRQRKQATASQWDEARRKSGWNLVELDASNQVIRFAIPGVRLDFGAIGKGLVVDRIAEKLLEMEIEQYVVNASGNMRIGKSPHNTEGWPIAIDVPATGSNDVDVELLRMRLSQCGVATSGDRWQRFPDGDVAGGGVGVVKSERSSHIIDPMTKAGVLGHQSVTIIAENAADADAAATATCVRARSDLAGWLQTLSEKKTNLQAMVLLRDETTASVRLISNAEACCRGL